MEQETHCGLSYAQLRDAQLDDPDISVVLNWLERLYTPVDSELSLISPAARSLWMLREQLVLIHGILHSVWSDCKDRGSCLVVPDSLSHKSYIIVMMQRNLVIWVRPKLWRG